MCALKPQVQNCQHFFVEQFPCTCFHTSVLIKLVSAVIREKNIVDIRRKGVWKHQNRKHGHLRPQYVFGLNWITRVNHLNSYIIYKEAIRSIVMIVPLWKSVVNTLYSTKIMELNYAADIQKHILNSITIRSYYNLKKTKKNRTVW